MIYLHKILSLLVSPLSLVIVVILLSLIVRSKQLCFSGLVILILCSLPIISRNCTNYVEKEYQLRTFSEIPSGDAVVVLSGMLRTVRTPNGVAYEWSDASDRIFAGIKLIENQKAPSLILTRGKLPWSTGKPEGEHLREIAIEMGVPKSKIFLTELVANTEQEAQATAKLLNLDKPRVILVTSAFHMSRAKLLFESAGIEVQPFAVDFRSSAKSLPTFLDFIPSASALADLSLVIKELLAMVYYKLKYN